MYIWNLFFFQDILRSIRKISFIFQTINLIYRELGEVDLKTAQVVQYLPRYYLEHKGS